jgi:hypothetical protein
MDGAGGRCERSPAFPPWRMPYQGPLCTVKVADSQLQNRNDRRALQPHAVRSKSNGRPTDHSGSRRSRRSAALALRPPPPRGAVGGGGEGIASTTVVGANSTTPPRPNVTLPASLLCSSGRASLCLPAGPSAPPADACGWPRAGVRMGSGRRCVQALARTAGLKKRTTPGEATTNMRIERKTKADQRKWEPICSGGGQNLAIEVVKNGVRLYVGCENLTCVVWLTDRDLRDIERTRSGVPRPDWWPQRNRVAVHYGT